MFNIVSFALYWKTSPHSNIYVHVHSNVYYIIEHLYFSSVHHFNIKYVANTKYSASMFKSYVHIYRIFLKVIAIFFFGCDSECIGVFVFFWVHNISFAVFYFQLMFSNRICLEISYRLLNWLCRINVWTLSMTSNCDTNNLF